MKKFFLILMCVILIGITTNVVWAEDASRLSGKLVVKDGETSFRRVIPLGDNPIGDIEDYYIHAKDINWEWYTLDEFEYVIMVAREPHKRVNFFRAPETLTWLYFDSAELGAERDKKILEQTLKDIKKGIKVSKPIEIYITDDGLYPESRSYPFHTGPTNFVGWANWYVYSHTFTDKAGKEVDLGIYETRSGLFNALKFYCDAEVRAGRMTKREANRMYRGLAHNVRNCDEVALSDKLLNFRKLYDPTLYNPRGYGKK